ncbi:pyridoxal kinase [Pseudoxanthomonas broegbernensis]|uniref:pyridoxal kinase n=1 Tax=Pseudoxanthomonas broegbernensis TaxID=83619 RepID=A0A7V8GPZ5_9GAMM|nr:pyridoxal kinase [Pseudoxanthomonas broegbernensis]KAF1688028.1 pyridoxal kinase [Pseudoxanthomonas broegbernensis]MBB6065055.1 pyridoxine kinase [Pseudoxanthomonas broegbernensis]
MSDSLETHLVHERGKRPSGPMPVDLVSVQSQLAYGHAGNSAAVPVLRMLGVRVAEVPTTLLSNTPFYPTLRGRVLPAEWLADLLRGLDERGVSARAPMLVSGYFGSVANGEAFAAWLEDRHAAGAAPRYLLDPVIGDTHTGAYVEPGLEAVFAQRLLPLAWMVTPNAFELENLSGRPALGQADALEAARALLARGPEWVLAHSVAGEGGDLLTLLVGRDAAWRLRSPCLDVDVAGTGDVLAALLAAFLLRGEAPPRAAERALAGVHAALESTLAHGWEELDVLAAPAAALADGPARFPAVPF